MKRAERLRFESVRQLGLIDDLDASPVCVQPDCPIMAAVYLHDCNCQFESRQPVSRYRQSAALVYSRGGRRWEGTAGAGGRALLFRPSCADYGTLKVENFLFDRLWQHQDLDTWRVPRRIVTTLGPWDHQGKKISFVRVRSPSGSFRTTEDRLRSHPTPVSAPGATQKFRLIRYRLFARLARLLRAAYIPRSPWGAAGNGG